MNWMAKTRPGSSPARSGASGAQGVKAVSAGAAAKPGPTPVSDSSPNTRTSNSLKEFLWLLSDIPQARILDLGSAAQSTINFFLEKGFRLTSEDLLRTWKEFLTTEEERLRLAPAGDGEPVSQEVLVDKFLDVALGYKEGNFHGVLAWDLLDYFDVSMVPKMMERIYDAMAPGGAMLALFHSKPAERFHRFRIIDTQKFEAVPASTLAVHAHVFANREILDLFGKFRSSKTFVGRDQIREALFLK